MSIPFIAEPIPLVGEVKIIRDLVPGNFGGCRIIQRGGEFRLSSYESLLNVSLSAEDALWIVETLKLVARGSDISRGVVVWEDS